MSNKPLWKVKQNPNDECYTGDAEVRETLATVMKTLNLYDYPIVLPFDNESSMFYKILKNEYHITPYMSGRFNYKQEYYPPNCLVISNPPFSKIKEIIKFYLDNNINFILIGYMNMVKYKVILENFNAQRLHMIYMGTFWFINNGKRMHIGNTILLSNVKLNHPTWTPEKEYGEVKENIVIKSERDIPFIDPNLYYTISYMVADFDRNKWEVKIAPNLMLNNKKVFTRFYFVPKLN